MHKYVPQTLVGPKSSQFHLAHETFPLLFAIDSDPPTCICDNTKELIKGKFPKA